MGIMTINKSHVKQTNICSGAGGKKKTHFRVVVFVLDNAIRKNQMSASWRQ